MSSATTTQHSATHFFSLFRQPFKFRYFLFRNLPAALFSGVRVEEMSEEKTIVSVPYTWFTRNPFRSTYFACLSMAAEMSTGILAMSQVYKRQPKVSMLVVGIEGKFHKKATARTRFICEEGARIREAVNDAILLGDPQTVRALSSGFNSGGELVAEFWITWSFRAKPQ
jgi:hypothetical protein